MIKKACVVVCFVVLLAMGTILEAQWAKAYGGKNDDWANDIVPAPFGGFIVVGATKSYLFYPGLSKSSWILKLDNNGAVIWQNVDNKTYSKSGESETFGVIVTRDSKIAALESGVFLTRDGGGFYGYYRIRKMDTDGQENFNFILGPLSVLVNFRHYSLCQISDGGYISVGAFPPNSHQMCVTKFDKLYQHRTSIYPDGPKYDHAQAVAATGDGGSIVAGWTKSFGAGSSDIWLLKLTSGCEIQWQLTYGGSGQDVAYDVAQTSDGGYVLLGQTDSSGAGGWDIWILKLDKKGTPEWQKTYGGAGGDYAHSIQQTRDGGYIVAGTTYSFGAKNGDAWVYKLDSKGGIVWQYRYGGNAYDGAWSVRQIPGASAGYVVAGKTRSYGAGGDDVLVMKLAQDGTIDPSCGVFINSTKAVAAATQRSPQATQVQANGNRSTLYSVFLKGRANASTAQTVICKK